jgi:hypothetical protein
MGAAAGRAYDGDGGIVDEIERIVGPLDEVPGRMQ